MRIIDLYFRRWAAAKERKPLLVRGARQVGKTFAIEQLGEEAFTHFCKIDFEEEPELKAAFEQDLVPERILRDLSSRKKTEIIPGQTLLFFDEVQACPKALMALRYFYEKMPDLHLIAAGSLLEFVLHDPDFSFPVGRVQPLYIRPLSFKEFLQARSEERALEWLQTATVERPVGTTTHLALLRLLKEYFIVGGMPRAVFGSPDFQRCRLEHQSILDLYASDFGKYAKYSQQKYLRILFERAPYLVGEHVKYVKIDPHVDSRALKTAIELLSRTGLIHRIVSSSASGVPLAAQINDKKFKLLFLDVGLQNARLNAPLDFLTQEDLTLIHSGALAEQFVGQELIAYTDPYFSSELFYWEREKQGSSAEIDYVIEQKGEVFPLEVKFGKKGKIRSLHQFMAEKKSRLGIRVSQAPLAREGNILSVPLYMLAELPRLIQLERRGITL